MNIKYEIKEEYDKNLTLEELKKIINKKLSKIIMSSLKEYNVK